MLNYIKSYQRLYSNSYPKFAVSLLALIFALFLTSWYITWKSINYAEHYKTSNELYLKDRNQIIEKVTAIYYTFSQVDAILKKLGLSTSILQNNFPPMLHTGNFSTNPFIPELDKTSKEQISSLLLLQYTPLEVGAALFQEIFPKIESKTKIASASVNMLQNIYQKVKVNILSIPTIAPVLGKLKSLFGKRIHPIYGEPEFHTGIDIANAIGTPVIATGNGTVTFASEKGGYGKTIIITHSPALQSQYSHLNNIAVKKNQPVQRGQTIGSIGSSGLSTGPHLHYEIHVKNHPVDPLQFILN